MINPARNQDLNAINKLMAESMIMISRQKHNIAMTKIVKAEKEYLQHQQRLAPSGMQAMKTLCITNVNGMTTIKAICYIGLYFNLVEQEKINSSLEDTATHEKAN